MSEGTVEYWYEAALPAVQEIARDALGAEQFSVLEENARVPKQVQGALIAVSSDKEAVQIGFTADEAGCATFSRALLGLGDDDPLSVTLFADGMREIVNMIAGAVKRRLPEQAPRLRLGLPLYVHGHLGFSDGNDRKATKITIGSHTCMLLLVRSGLSG